jgi:hypothetical protein
MVTTPPRFVHLVPVLVFLALRALSHAHPAPLPWTTGVFDADGLDDVLQTIRTTSAGSADAGAVRADVSGIPTGRVTPSEPTRIVRILLDSRQSRAPPLA